MDQFSTGRYPGAALPASYFAVGTSSFTDFLTAAAPELLPGRAGRGRRHRPGRWWRPRTAPRSSR